MLRHGPARGLRVGLAVALLALSAGLPQLQAGQVTAAFSPTSVHLGGAVQFSLTYTDVAQSTIREPRLPAVDGLDFRPAGQSSQIRIVNGQTTQSITLDYEVKPQREGEFTLPAFEVPVGGGRLRTQPVTLKVLPRGQQLPADETQRQWAYLTLNTSKPTVFVGELLPVEVSLYFLDARDYVPAPLNNPGFVFGAIGAGGQGRVSLNGRFYSVIRYVQNAFPIHAGDLVLGPAKASVRIPVQSSGPTSRFGSPFNFDLFGSRYQTVNLTTDPKTIKVKPLPTVGQPDDFGGAVGQYAMTVSASPTNVAVGEPIRLKIQIAGEGLLDNVSVPLGETWEGFTLYPPQSRVEITDKVRNAGIKTVEQDIVPQRTGLDHIPPVRFSHFDPEAAAYRTLKREPIRILVRPAALAQVLPPLRGGGSGGGERGAAVPQEIVPLKQSLGTLVAIRPPLITQAWYQGLLLVPVLAWGGALSWRRRQDRLANDPRLARSLAFGRVRGRLLTELRRLAGEGDGTAFFAHAFRVLQEQIGERLDLPAAAITEAVLEERLKPLGAPEPLLQDLHELFHVCDQARYAPVAESKDLPAIAAKIEQVLAEARRLKT
jgi:hypothetical protein